MGEAFDPKKHLTKVSGKDYLEVKHRLRWLLSEDRRYAIETELVGGGDTFAIVRAKVSIIDESGAVVRSAMALKREDKADFGDFTEKADTGATGRALAKLGYGTDFALGELEERKPVDTPARGGRRTTPEVVATTLKVEEVSPTGIRLAGKTSWLAYPANFPGPGRLTEAHIGVLYHVEAKRQGDGWTITKLERREAAA